MRDNREKRSQKASTDGFVRGFGCCASVFILVIGAVILGIMIGLGLKDAKLIRSASKLEVPTRASDFQNVFVKRSSSNITAPLKLKRANTTNNNMRFRGKSFGPPVRKNNVTAAVEKNLDQAQATYKFEQAKALSSKLRGDIHDYWQVDAFPEFKKTMHIPKSEWETYKKKFEYLLTHPNSTKTFVIAFGGSSVTAGHDNYLNEAYPALVRTQLAPIFDLLGVRLQVLNVGIGNNPCYPYDMCLESHIPPTADLISWEQSLNCGRNPEPVESFIRTSAQSSKKPMILLMSSGTPYWEPEDCAAISPEPVPLTPQEQKEARLPLDILANQSSILWDSPYLQLPDGTSKSANNLALYYKKVAPISGQSLMALGKYKCKGPYGADFGAKTLGKGKSWHPGVKGHKLRADSFSYFLTSILSNALSDIVMFQEKTNKKVRETWTARTLVHIKTHTWDPKTNPLPPPLLCSQEVCRGWVKPTCKTMIQPQYNPPMSLKNALVVPGSVPVGWTAELSWMDVAGVAKAVEQKRNYLDKKIIFVSDSNTTSPLSFVVDPKTKDSLVWLCQVSRGFAKYPATMGELDSAAVVTVEPYQPATAETKKKVPSTPRVLTMKKVGGENECFQSVERIGGKSKLTIQKAKASVQINLAYLVYW